MNANQILYGACIILTGLLAGLFYGWKCSVMNGLALLPDKEYLMAFQSMNKAILNPVFFLSFMGSLIALAITTFVFYRGGNIQLLPYLIISLIIYGVGVFGITTAFNIPLNETVAAFNISTATEEQIKAMRFSFENPWNMWHLIRTLASIASFIILTIPLLKKL
jgi:uncharacterized membrane protein